MSNFDRREKWDRRFIELAKNISDWSLDPSTRTGAVIYDKENRIISTGYNGFPKGIEDKEELLENREKKYPRMSHCEMNAILFAHRDLTDCCLATYPFMSCARCAVSVIQSGIKKCVAPKLPEHLKIRWEKDTILSKELFKEAKVELIEYNFEEKKSPRKVFVEFESIYRDLESVTLEVRNSNQNLYVGSILGGATIIEITASYGLKTGCLYAEHTGIIKLNKMPLFTVEESGITI